MADDDTITISRRTARLLGALGLVVAGAVTPALVGGGTDAPSAFPPIPGLSTPSISPQEQKRIARLERELGITLDPVEAAAEIKRDVAALRDRVKRAEDETRILKVQIEELRATSVDAVRLAPLLDSLETIASDMAKNIGQNVGDVRP